MYGPPPGFELVAPIRAIGHENQAYQNVNCDFAAFETVSSSATAMPSYEMLEKLGSGSYGTVYKCRDRLTGRFAACKRMSYPPNSKIKLDIIPEIWVHKELKKHDNILQLFNFMYTKETGHVDLFYELMDSDLHSLFQNPATTDLRTETNIRFIMRQLLTGLSYLHSHQIIHADLKPENLLVHLTTFTIKIGDLGNATPVSSHPCEPKSQECVGSCWFRAPEILLTNGFYGTEADLWSVGCIFFELMTGTYLFSADDEITQVSQIHNLITRPPPIVLDRFIQMLEVSRPTHYTGTSYHKRFNDIEHMLIEISNEIEDGRIFSLAPGSLPFPKHVDKNGSPCWQSDFRRLAKQFPVLKTIKAEPWSLLTCFLQYDEYYRISADLALHHAYFAAGGFGGQFNPNVTP